MKKWMLLIGAVLILFSSCEKGEYKSVIPENARMVMSVDLAELASDADLQNSAVVDLLRKTVGLVATGSVKRKVNAFIENPIKMGFDLRESAYLFQTPNESYGLALKVGDKGDVDDLFKLLSKQGLCSKITENDGRQWGALFDEIQFAYDSDAFLLLLPTKGEGAEMVKKMIAQCFTLEKKNQFVESEQYDKIEAEKGAIRLFSKGNALPAVAETYVQNILPKTVRTGDVELRSSFQFENGFVKMSAKLFSENEAVQKLLNEADDKMHRVHGKFANVADGSFVWSTLGCDGEWLLGVLKRNETLRNYLMMVERAVDIEKMLKAVDGDVTFVVRSTNAALDGNASVMAMAEVERDGFLSDVDDWQTAMRDYHISMQKVGANQYRISADDYQLNWGVVNNNLYFASDNAFDSKMLEQTKKVTIPSHLAEMDGSKMFTYIDLTMLPVSNFDLAGLTITNPLTELEGLVIKSDKIGEFEFRLIGKDKSQSLLRSLLAK